MSFICIITEKEAYLIWHCQKTLKRNRFIFYFIFFFVAVYTPSLTCRQKDQEACFWKSISFQILHELNRKEITRWKQGLKELHIEDNTRIRVHVDINTSSFHVSFNDLSPCSNLQSRINRGFYKNHFFGICSWN